MDFSSFLCIIFHTLSERLAVFHCVKTLHRASHLISILVFEAQASREQVHICSTNPRHYCIVIVEHIIETWSSIPLVLSCLWYWSTSEEEVLIICYLYLLIY